MKQLSRKPLDRVGSIRGRRIPERTPTDRWPTERALSRPPASNSWLHV